ncbi:MAG: 2-succinyl-5-enolpyruvyl-6-hydroxy-3-cyclohexene-1-carboxylic-acid synthase [Parachlamydiaceae bacterium]|nr:2-succinyl-5-enolpyruvyl-6-hydroxy-3-cyclohexene-1-carboxylic-acid synthase [Parachlamydiaceae bacterium]
MIPHIYQHVLEEVVKAGITEFCLCPGSRNSPLINCLMQSPLLKKHFWYEERSAAFFALGRARSTRKPVAIITTSGTAAGELLPAAMEAHYTGTPILLITADRPRRFRGTGAPQTAEQENLFGIYAHFSQDLEGDERCKIHQWDWSGPAHLNICIEDPQLYPGGYQSLTSFISQNKVNRNPLPVADSESLNSFFRDSKQPLVIVSSILKEEQAAVTEFLLRLNAPIYCESGSGLREDPRVKHLQIRTESAIWKLSERNGYVIDGILRIGDVPVTRLWRDLEDRADQLAECSLSNVPFSGLSWGRHIQCRLNEFLPNYAIPFKWKNANFMKWQKADRQKALKILALFEQFPSSEPALFHALSKQIPEHSLVYLGNSLPIREWDLAASENLRHIEIQSSRGVNGIDGQLSTFLGLCEPGRENWTIVGDLTALYDFPALWILQSLPEMPIKIIVVNNGGGKIFARIYKDPIFQHLHNFDFEHFAKSWKIPYFCFNGTALTETLPLQAFVEICPDPAVSDAFWGAYDKLK